MLSGDNIEDMTDRRSRQERRDEVVEAALGLLADQPLEALSTRQLAKALGLSQPALFRHFRSRDGMLLAVVERVRAELGAAVAEAMSPAQDPVGELRALVATLLGAVQVRPGLPRLLFSLASPPDGPVRTALLSLATSHKRLITDRIADGQRLGLIASTVEPQRAATHLVGLVQGVIFQWVAGGRIGDLAAEAEPLMGLWVDGAAGDGVPLDVPAASEPPRIVRVDGRALLALGIDPLAAVLDGLEGAGPGSVLRLDAPFPPRPLVSLLEARGMAVRVLAHRDDHHALTAWSAPATEPVDLRGLEAPEPLEQVLLATGSMGAGDVFLARTPRVPKLLLGRLAERGLGAEVLQEDDGSALLLCWSPS